MAAPTAKKFYRGINLQRNTLLKAVVESGDTSTIDGILTVLGQFGYDTTLKRAKFFDGVSATNVLQSDDISTSVTLGGTASSDTLVPSQKAVKDYVDGAVTSLLDFKGNIAAGVDYPVGVVGDAYYVTSAGLIGGASGKTVNIGDALICKTNDATGGDEATSGAKWFVLESNRDQATESILGVLKIASQASVTTGTNDTDAVTPLKLATELTSRLSGMAKRDGGTAATTANTTLVVAHTITGGIPIIQIKESGDDITDGVQLNIGATSFGITTSIGLTFSWVAVG